MVKSTHYLALDLNTGIYRSVNLTCMGTFSFYIYLIGCIYHEGVYSEFWREDEAMEWIESKVDLGVDVYSWTTGFIRDKPKVLTEYDIVIKRGTLDKYTGQAILE